MLGADSLTSWLNSFSNIMSLEVFTFFAALVEEVIAPIPSPFVMTFAGSLAYAQGYSMFTTLVYISLLGAVGKVIGSWILFYVAGELEEAIISRFGKFLGVTQEDIERIGAKFSSSWKDALFIFSARALPIIPSAPVSVVCGLFKLDLKTYLVSTFLGTIVRNIIYLYVGYVGLESYNSMIHGFDKAESIVQIFIALGLVALVGWAYLKRGKSKKE